MHSIPQVGVLDEETIKNIFGKDNFEGTARKVYHLDIEEIMYYADCGEYKETRSPIDKIFIEY